MRDLACGPPRRATPRVTVMRPQAMSAAQQLGSVKLAYQVLDIPRSAFYRWRKRWLRYGFGG